MAYRYRYPRFRTHLPRSSTRPRIDRGRRRGKDNPVAGLVLLAVIALIAGLNWIVNFAEQNPGEVAGLAALALSPLLAFAWFKLRKRAQRKREEELRRIAEVDRRMAEDRAARAVAESDIDAMTGAQLELYLKRVFEYLGFQVEHVGKRGDQGADLILTKNGQRVACQCKRYKGHPVTNKAVQEAFTAQTIYGCQKSLVVTSSRYTKSAREAADRCGCELIDRQRLGMIVATYREDRLGKREHLTQLLGVKP
jgi:HJR/Mrr/RecB family endonuclease